MILELLLSVVITLGASGPTGNFNECPPSDQPDAVATAPAATTTTTSTAVKKKG